MEQTGKIDNSHRAQGSDLKVVQLNPTYEGFGMVMDYLSRRLPFAGFEAGLLTDAIHQQLKYGHHLVALRGDRVTGYAGWLLTSSEIAEAWVEDRGRLVRKEGNEATAAALTIVASEDRAAVAKLIRGARRLNPGKRAYFKRSASDVKPARKRSVRV
jgi:hypothetical protein